MASIFFSMYIGIVFYVMINIIIGVVTKYFDQVLYCIGHTHVLYTSPAKVACLQAVP